MGFKTKKNNEVVSHIPSPNLFFVTASKIQQEDFHEVQNLICATEFIIAVDWTVAVYGNHIFADVGKHAD